MPYSNPSHRSRLTTIARISDPFSNVSTLEAAGARAEPLTADQSLVVYEFNSICEPGNSELYHLPFLFHANGDPWHEANSYVLSVIRDSPVRVSRTDGIRKLASKLLDYLRFCEDNEQEWLDFSGTRMSMHPTTRYFHRLITEGKRSNSVINQYTGAVYGFYQYVSENWHPLYMNKVDTVKYVKMMVETSTGTKSFEVRKRGQTKKVPRRAMPQIGYIREDGEDLRPLHNSELQVLMLSLSDGEVWSAVERLIVHVSLLTGARKQTVLTLRLRHLKRFRPEFLQKDNTYKLFAGPGTGIDTKNNKLQDLYFPRPLAEELCRLIASPLMLARQKKFQAKLAKEFPQVQMTGDEMYVFLSDQGNSYYMAKDDPRYTLVKSPQSGQVADTIRRKIRRLDIKNFPCDFTCHWLRATYAYILYQRLKALVSKELLPSGDIIDFIQSRMHHEARETTENYLKLFTMTHEKVLVQEFWEYRLFEGAYEISGGGLSNA